MQNDPWYHVSVIFQRNHNLNLLFISHSNTGNLKHFDFVLIYRSYKNFKQQYNFEIWFPNHKFIQHQLHLKSWFLFFYISEVDSFN